MNESRVAIPDYIGPQVVEGARALARSGSEVTLATWVRGRQLGRFRSRAFRDVESISNPKDATEDFLLELGDLHASRRFTSVIPFGLQAFQALTLDPDREARALPLLLPKAEVFQRLNDKDSLVEFATKIGVPTPARYDAASESDLEAVARDAPFPLVVKVTSGSGVAAGLRYANNAEELRSCWRELMSNATRGGASAPKLLVQEFVPGRIHDACTLTIEGEPIQVLTQVRQLMYPIYGGVGAINVTTHEPKLRELAATILSEAGYHGPAQVEFKKDARDGTYKLIEVNPKLWGTLALSIAAGISFPCLIRDHLEGKTVPRHQPYPVGLRYNFWFPLAILARVQLVREFGLRGLSRLPKSSRQTHDVDWRDLPADLHRILGTLKQLKKRKLLDVTRNLPKDLVPVPWD